MRKAKLAFLVLDTVLTRAGVRSRQGLAPIVFEIIDLDEVWSFDPASQELFAQTDTAYAGLRISLHSDVLLRLALGTRFYVEPNEAFRCVGDVSLLRAVSNAMSEPRDGLSLRCLRRGDSGDF